MGSKSTIVYTTGSPGAGKTYRRCGFYLLEEFFSPDTDPDMQYWTNFDIEFDPWTDSKGREQKGLCELVKEKYGVDREDVISRVHVFPEEVLSAWRNEEWEDSKDQRVSGPWDFFAEKDIPIDNTHIAIDEIHEYNGKRKARKIQARWESWLSEIRHEGATIEFITQDPGKMSTVVEENADIRLHISKLAAERDTLFNIPNSEWWSLLTVFGWKYRDISNMREMKKDESGKFDYKKAYDERFYLRPECFGVFKSNSETRTGRAGGRESRLPHEYLGSMQLVFRFLGKYWLNLCFSPMMRALLVVAGVMCLLGLALYLLTGQYIPKNTDAEKKEVTEVDSRPVVSSSEPLEQVDQDKTSEAAEVVAPQPEKDELVAIGPDEIIFNSGLVFGIGEKIDEGEHKDKTILSIDRKRRRVHLDDGSFIHLRWASTGLFSQSEFKTGSDRANVSGSDEPSKDGQRPTVRDGGQGPTTGNAVGGRLADEKGGSVPGEQVRSLDGSIERSGSARDQPRGIGRTIRPSSRRVSKASE